MAERGRFELPEACASAVFKTAALNHSTISPRQAIILPVSAVFSSFLLRNFSVFRQSQAPGPRSRRADSALQYAMAIAVNRESGKILPGPPVQSPHSRIRPKTDFRPWDHGIPRPNHRKRADRKAIRSGSPKPLPSVRGSRNASGQCKIFHNEAPRIVHMFFSV